MRRGIWVGISATVFAALLSPPLACAAEAERLTFPGTAWNAVKVVRGGAAARDIDLQKPVREKAETAETVSFVERRMAAVRVLRGETGRGTAMPGKSQSETGTGIEV